MASGVHHYREAERLADQAEKLFSDYVDAHDEEGPTPGVELIGRQVEHCREMGVLHATLALAAATALNDAEGGMSSEDYNAWCRAASEIPASEIPSGGES